MDSRVDNDFALLYGIMLGDGCLSLVRKKDRKAQMKFVTITGSLVDDYLFFENIVHPLLKKFREKDTKIKIRKDCNAIEFNFTDSKLFDLFHSVGFPIGKKENRLFIPKMFYDNHLVESVISGFFATDGSIVLTKNPNKYYPRLEAHVIARDLIKEIYDFLSQLGFEGHFYKCKRKVRDIRWKNTQDQYRFQFNGKKNLILFSEKIGFVNPRYQEKFRGFLEYDTRYNRTENRKMAAPGIEPGTPSS